jgi:hypothetical protein
MRSSGSKIQVASAPENTKVSVTGRGTEESVVRSRSGRSGGRKMVEKVGGGVTALCLEARGQGGLDQKSAHDDCSWSESCARPCRSVVKYMDKTYVTEHLG